MSPTIPKFLPYCLLLVICSAALAQPAYTEPVHSPRIESSEATQNIEEVSDLWHGLLRLFKTIFPPDEEVSTEGWDSEPPEPEFGPGLDPAG